VNMRYVHVFVTGRVQGVGYRAFVARGAFALDLAGWVRNLSDGSVEIMASGPADVIDKFVMACRQAPLPAHVMNITVKDLPYEHDLTRPFGVLPTLS
jgi:acylphosphatase